LVMRPPIGERNPPGNDLAMERLLRQSTFQTLDVCHDGAAPPRRETAELSSRSVTIDAAVQMATEPGQTSFTGAGSAAAGVVNPQVLICILFSGHCHTYTHTHTHIHTHTHTHTRARTHTHTHTFTHTHTHTHTHTFTHTHTHTHTHTQTHTYTHTHTRARATRFHFSLHLTIHLTLNTFSFWLL
jgi:hypothetical protein